MSVQPKTPLKTIKEDSLSPSKGNESPLIMSPTINIESIMHEDIEGDDRLVNDVVKTPVGKGKPTRNKRKTTTKRNADRITSERSTVEGSPVCYSESRKPFYPESVTKHNDKKRNMHSTPAAFKNVSFSPTKASSGIHSVEGGLTLTESMLDGAQSPAPMSKPFTLGTSSLMSTLSVPLPPAPPSATKSSGELVDTNSASVPRTSSTDS